MALIVQARPDHAQTLTEIAISAKRHWKYPERWMKCWLPALTISSEYIASHETWLAMLNEKPVAWYSLAQDEADLWLDNLWVLPDFMGRGIGQSLFRHALERCQFREAKVLKMEADPNAKSFYEKMGAKQIGEHHGEVDGEPRILPVMEVSF